MPAVLQRLAKALRVPGDGAAQMSDSEIPYLLQAVRDRVWFYEFELPDGTRTRTDIPEAIARIHTSRRTKLRQVIQQHIPDSATSSALDFASHEGYFSIELARHFASVRGLEVRRDSIDAARLITRALGIRNIVYEEADLQRLPHDEALSADLVLVFGLIYHLENPIHALRLAASLSRRHILIETQIFPYDVSGRIEDGHYLGQRPVQGVFSLSADYSSRREGGSTDLALIPSLNALLFLLRTFGFETIEVLDSDANDYEQFRRGSRVVVYGAKSKTQ